MIGGGHAHVHLLKMFGMEEYRSQISGIRLTLITRDVNTPYSGMLPGFVAGHYTHSECHIDLSVLSRFSNVRLLHCSATSVTISPDGASKYVHLSDGRPPVRFDALSLDVGSSPSLSECSLASDVTPVKPIDGFGDRWSSLLGRVRLLDGTFDVVVVGGGAGGIELALSMHHRLQDEVDKLGKSKDLVRVSLVSRSEGLLRQHNAAVGKIFERILRERNIQVFLGAGAEGTEKAGASSAKFLVLTDGRRLPYDECIWCTNASAAPWLSSGTPFQTTSDGFLVVDDNLQMPGFPGCFAAGDCSHNNKHPRPKAGVFAVRAGPPLRDNLLAFLHGKPLTPYTPQTEFLGIISTGDKYAVASRGTDALEGKFLWKLKDTIDRTWMSMYQVLPAMSVDASSSSPLPELARSSGAEAMAAFAAAPMRCGGCGAKVGSDVLARVLSAVMKRAAGQASAKSGGAAAKDPLQEPAAKATTIDMDDCAVVEPPPPGTLMVHTIDFFRSFVSDPFVFGKIAAIHALSDCHAMGAKATTALALAVVPFAANDNITEDTLIAMLGGAHDVLVEDGCKLVGGHTCEGSELGLGFAVNGYIEKNRVMRKKGGKVGNKIVLTKKIGTGALFASEMRGKCLGSHRSDAIQMMTTSNGAACREIRDNFETWHPNACTDVTGFGLVGHLVEMLDFDAGLGCKVHLDAVPFLQGAIEAGRQGIFSSLHKANANARRVVSNHVQAARACANGNDVRYQLLFDPQTSGGLLFMIDEGVAEDFVKRMVSIGYEDCCVIGELCEIEKKEKKEKPSGGGGGGGAGAGGGDVASEETTLEDETCSIERKPVIEIVIAG